MDEVKPEVAAIEPAPGTPTDEAPSAPSLAQRFHTLARQWKAETAFSSSLTEIAENPAYQQIIGLGKDAIPLILDELRREPDYWFAALKALTGKDPVQPADRGKARRMADAWLNWAKANGF